MAEDVALKLGKDAKSASVRTLRKEMTPSGGLSQAIAVSKAAGRMKRLLEKPNGPDSSSWKTKTSDLQQVFRIFQGLFLTLEHYNEPLLRVGVELVCCRKARECLSWDESWFSNEEKNQKFRNLVGEKLTEVLDVRNAGAEKAAEAEVQPGKKPVPHTEDPEVEMRKGLERKIQVLELKLQEALGKITDLEQRNDQIEQTVLKYQVKERETRIELQTAQKSASEAKSSLENVQSNMLRVQALLKDTEDAKRSAELRASQAEAKLQTVEDRVRAAEERARAAEENARAADERAAKVEASAKGAEQRAREAEAAAQDAVSRVRSAEARAKSATDRADALEKELSDLREKLKAEKTQVEEEKRRSAQLKQELEERPPQVQAMVTEAVQTVNSSETDVCNDQELKEKLRAAEDENRRLRLLLEELQAKLREFEAAAKEAGIGDQVGNILRGVGLGAAIESTSVWDRLYQDAFARIGRIEELRLKYRKLTHKEMFPGVASVQGLVEESSLAQQIAPPSATVGQNMLEQIPSPHQTPQSELPAGLASYHCGLWPLGDAISSRHSQEAMDNSATTGVPWHAEEQPAHRTTARGRRLGASASHPSLRKGRAPGDFGKTSAARMMGESVSLPQLRKSTGKFRLSKGSGFTIYGHKGASWVQFDRPGDTAGAGVSALSSTMRRQRATNTGKHWRC
eukprot:gnl/TRDRNA2_/TRDRNA2_116490_c0_seq1.p1 gnl/TRDRNA2_/TRDRNA2_116490_c0~~gnl/TRDRNA2_/TRDRNA2_116490_c0_seq1.p1  ORF type:complete len:685 (+),score=166.93 gnl/TRDRNA2_/TRDRNA2_116490_c0_seq1:186-2240(+)